MQTLLQEYNRVSRVHTADPRLPVKHGKTTVSNKGGKEIM